MRCDRKLYADEIAVSLLFQTKAKGFKEAIDFQQPIKKELTKIQGVSKVKAAIIITALELEKRISNSKPDTKKRDRWTT